MTDNGDAPEEAAGELPAWVPDAMDDGDDAAAMEAMAAGDDAAEDALFSSSVPPTNAALAAPAIVPRAKTFSKAFMMYLLLSVWAASAPVAHLEDYPDLQCYQRKYRDLIQK